MRVIFTSTCLLFLIGAVVATALPPPKSYLPNPHLRGGNAEEGLELASHLRHGHGRTLLTGPLPVTYTLDAHFDDGAMVNVNHDVADQLQLDSKSNPFNFIWVACSGRGTVVKVDTISGSILGEYRSAPDGLTGNPSRTTVDQDGSVWLSNRNDVGPGGYGTIVHIGLNENNQCEDRNSSAVIDTSTGLGDIRAWADASVKNAKDECIVHYTVVKSKGTRHVSIDAKNNVWVGGSSLRNFDLITGGRFDTPGSGTIIRSELSVGFGGYGGLMDNKGVIWSARPLLRWDTANPLTGNNGDPAGPAIGPPTADKNWAGQSDFDSYGLCIDGDGNVWNTAWSNYIHKYKSNGEYINKYDHGFNGAQGCVVDQKGDVWVAHSTSGSSVGHLNNAGIFLGNVGVGSGPTGVAVDALGKVWSANLGSSTLSRIDPTKNGGIGEVDLTVNLGSGCNPYNYGDMTGSTNIAPPNSGSWIVVHDSGDPTTKWRRIEWTADVPTDSKLTVEVSSDGAVWTPVTNGQELLSQTGQTLHVRVLFERASNSESPVLYDLSLFTNEPPDCDNAVASPSDIWPPNHKFRSVVVNGVTDPDDDEVTIKVTGIFQDESVNTQGDGNTCADGKITATGGAEVRAERIGTKQAPGDGRVYHIEFTADDGNGGTCDGEVTVCVPHDQGNKKTCVDGGKINDSTKCP